MPKKPSSTETKFVYCFQEVPGQEAPFLAELVSETPQQATLKIGKKEVKVNRAACSTTPYTKADLEKYGGVKTEVAPGVKDGSAPKPQKSASLKGFFS